MTLSKQTQSAPAPNAELPRTADWPNRSERWSSRVRSVVLVLIAATTTLNAASADEISWVGYQFGPPGGLRNPFQDASFHHGDNWFNYVVPDADDVAIFDVGFDPQDNGMPRVVYLGDYTVGIVPLFHPTPTFVPGGDAVVGHLVIRDGDFEFRMSDDRGAPQASLTTVAQLTVGDVDGASAEMRIRSGLLTTGFVTHIARGEASRGTVDLDGTDAKWIHNSYLDLGWVGEGRVSVRSGASATLNGNVYAGIRDESSGALEVQTGGRVDVNGALLIGNGHEAEGGARGVLSVSGAGSLAKTQYLQIGGAGGSGEVIVSRGGAVEIDHNVGVISNPRRSSRVRILGDRSHFDADGDLNIDADVTSATFAVDSRATASFNNVSINSDGTGPIGPATVSSKSGALLDVDSSVLLYGHGKSTLDARGGGRIEIGDVHQSAAPDEIRIGAGGLVGGIGVLGGRVVVEPGGVLRPGFSPGLLDIEGDLDLSPGSSLTLEIGGPTLDLRDRITVSGTLTLGGELVVRFLDGYVPTGGFEAPLLTASHIATGAEFSSVRFEDIAPELIPDAWRDGSFALGVVPEPATLQLAAVIALAQVGLRRLHGARQRLAGKAIR